jgi:hypothetical protein
LHLTAEEGLNIFFSLWSGGKYFLTKIKCRFLITKFRQKVFFKLFLVCKNWIKKSTFLFELCVREEIHSQGRSSRWEKIHTLGFFNAKNCINTKFFLFISIMIIADYSAYISELPKDELKMRSTGNPVWNQGGF